MILNTKNIRFSQCGGFSRSHHIYLHFQKIMFCVQLYRKWVRGHYNLYFEALKGLLFKNALIFYLIFAENVTLLPLNKMKLIPCPRGLQPQGINSLLSPCYYTMVYLILLNSFFMLNPICCTENLNPKKKKKKNKMKACFEKLDLLSATDIRVKWGN